LPTPLGLVWAKGFRNPWRFSFDRATGDIYVADVGQAELEEIDFQPADSTGGENYGWNFYEGTDCFADTPCPNRSQFVEPIYEYRHSPEGAGAESITGGYVYRGCAMPDLRGTYFYADFIRGFVRSFRYDGSSLSDDRDHTVAVAPGAGLSIDNPSTFGEDGRGELYIADFFDGEIFKIVPAVLLPANAE
jgi:glucose/arabinose dehydrogenase